MCSSDLTARGLKVFSGADGFDPDGSTDVLIDTCFVDSNDDAVAVKARDPGHNSSCVTVRRSEARRAGPECRTTAPPTS